MANGKDYQTLETISDAKARKKFDRLCKEIRELADKEAETKEVKAKLMEDASQVAKRYNLTGLKTDDYLWLRIGEIAGNVNVKKLKQVLLEELGDMDLVDEVIEKSRNKPRPPHYQCRKVG